MRLRSRHRTTAPLAAVVLTASLGGCAFSQPEPSGAPTPAPTETVTVTATPEPTPTQSPPAAALVIPDCEQLVPIDTIQQYESWRRVVLIQSMEGTAIAEDLPGPAARQAASRAQQNRGCLLGVPQSDSAVGVYTLEITPEARDDLIEQLRTDGGYAESQVDGAPSFAIATEEGLGGTTVSYTFVGDAWLILRGSLIDAQTAAWIAAPTVAQLRAANPGLDDR
ncbi:hypothetical protein [Microbacterium sp.]|uniref:hypothetical protein n=1 Tax=Microbacterium sp. TaxID=51671 RepID=UPI003C73D248